MNYEYISTDDTLRQFCSQIRSASVIAFDTEFVSEDRYFPELCLVQIAADGQLAIIDSLAVKDMTPLWQLLAAPGHISLVHAGREEFRFCRRAVGDAPPSTV